LRWGIARGRIAILPLDSKHRVFRCAGYKTGSDSRCLQRESLENAFMFKKICTALILCLGIVTAENSLAESCSYSPPQVSLQLTAETWVTTQSAKVTVSWDAALNKEQLANAQNGFQQALSKLAPNATWHITEFTRTPSKTNLEQIHATAEARLPDSALAGLRDRAKNLSSEGQTYVIQDIVYTPTETEIAAARAQLRSQIYAQAKDELSRLNAVYPNVTYRLYNISFSGVNGQMMPTPNFMAKATSENVGISGGREMQNMATSQLLTQDAVVVFAAPAGNLCAGK
jgi:hypothetical protein